MINNSKLDSVKDKIKKELETKFPFISFDLQPYYMGMGYFGLEIKFEEILDKNVLEEVDMYYSERYQQCFLNYIITNGPTPKETNVLRPGEVRITKP